MDHRDANGLSTPHGQKRHADDNLDNEQRLAKRFNSLNIGMFSTDATQYQ